MAQAVAAGFMEAARKALSNTAAVTCVKMEPASLAALLKSTALTGMKVRFDAGISGSALILITQPDLARTGSLISGLELGPGEAISAEVELCKPPDRRA